MPPGEKDYGGRYVAGSSWIYFVADDRLAGLLLFGTLGDASAREIMEVMRKRITLGAVSHFLIDERDLGSVTPGAFMAFADLVRDGGLRGRMQRVAMLHSGGFIAAVASGFVATFSLPSKRRRSTPRPPRSRSWASRLRSTRTYSTRSKTRAPKRNASRRSCGTCAPSSPRTSDDRASTSRHVGSACPGERCSAVFAPRARASRRRSRVHKSASRAIGFEEATTTSRRSRWMPAVLRFSTSARCSESTGESPSAFRDRSQK